LLLTACANVVAEELFFHGALWSLVQDAHPLVKTTLAYAATTAATRNPALMLAGTATSVLFGLQRRTSGGILAPALTHLTWSLLMLSYLPPRFQTPRPAEITPGLTACAAWQMAADSAPAPHRTRRSARGSPWIMLSFSRSDSALGSGDWGRSDGSQKGSAVTWRDCRGMLRLVF